MIQSKSIDHWYRVFVSAIVLALPGVSWSVTLVSASTSTSIDPIEGTWNVVQLTQNGESQNFDNRMRYRFKRGRAVVRIKGQPSADLHYTTDTSNTPHQLDIVFDVADKETQNTLIQMRRIEATPKAEGTER